MYLEIDDVAVLTEDWIGVLKGDDEAKMRVRADLDGLVIYSHALSGVGGPEYTQVTLRMLQAYGIIRSVTLHKDIV